jgi:hypothetical protein
MMTEDEFSNLKASLFLNRDAILTALTQRTSFLPEDIAQFPCNRGA